MLLALLILDNAHIYSKWSAFFYLLTSTFSQICIGLAGGVYIYFKRSQLIDLTVMLMNKTGITKTEKVINYEVYGRKFKIENNAEDPVVWEVNNDGRKIKTLSVNLVALRKGHADIFWHINRAVISEMRNDE